MLINLPLIIENINTYFDYSSLEILANIVVIISVSLSPLYFFVRRREDKRTNRKNAGNSILQEIKDIQDNLAGTGELELKYIKFERDGEKLQVRFYSVYIEYTGFQSAINSGHYTLFPSKLQQVLNEIYLRMKLNNNTMDQNQELVCFCTKEEIERKSTRYYDIMADTWIQLTKIQKELSDNIETAIKYLEKDIKKSGLFFSTG